MWILPEDLQSPIQAIDCIGQCSLFHSLQRDIWVYRWVKEKKYI